MNDFSHNYNINSQITYEYCDSWLLFFLQALVYVLMPQMPPFIGKKTEMTVLNQSKNSNLIGDAPFFKAANLLNIFGMSPSKFNIFSCTYWKIMIPNLANTRPS